MPEPHAVLNALSPDEAREALLRCCGSERWARAMLDLRPFVSTRALHQAAREVWAQSKRGDLLEAFSHHPAIGADITLLREKFAKTIGLSAAEQSAVAESDTPTLEALRDGNLAYQARFGFIFIVCATGKSAREMLALLEERIHNDPETELRLAALEQAKITQLRLEKLGS